MIKRVMVLALALVFILALGCSGEKKEEKAAKKTPELQEKAKAEVEAKKEETPPAQPPAAPPAPVVDEVCFGSLNDVPAKEIVINGKKYSLAGYKLSLLEPDADDEVIFGVISDIKTALDPTFANIDQIYKWFEQEKVDYVLVLGDTSEDYGAMSKVFAKLGELKLPAIIIMGNREIKADYDKAITEAGEKYPNIINGNRVRLIDTDDADVITLAGYYDVNYIHHQPGCNYGAREIQEIETLKTKTDSPVVFISHGPPRGIGKDAIDAAAEAGNVGDPALGKVITALKIPFGAFGNIHEAGGRAVGADFTTALEQGKMHDSLYLNPGPCDSDPWPMNDGTTSKGMAGLLHVKGGKAAFKIMRVK